MGVRNILSPKTYVDAFYWYSSSVASNKKFCQYITFCQRKKNDLCKTFNIYFIKKINKVTRNNMIRCILCERPS